MIHTTRDAASAAPTLSLLARAARTVVLPLALLAMVSAMTVDVAEAARPRRGRISKHQPRRSAKKPQASPLSGLVWHVETIEGASLDSRLADDPINPASVTKVATTLWALETLGPDHRFDTRVLAGGPVRDGELDGDLLVQGGGDPDFQVENALLLAHELNQKGVRRVSGALVVDHRFWMGREDGSQGRIANPAKRAVVMAARLRQALDPARWNGLIRYAWTQLALRRGFDVSRPPRVTIAGKTEQDDTLAGDTLFVHRSRPLVQTLRQLDAYSNNDIERVGANIGTPTEMSAWLARRLGLPAGSIRFQTTSGLGQNRITPRHIVALMRELDRTTTRLGLTLNHVLPAAGCDPGTVTRFYQRIANGPAASTVIGKTGTLTSTDGGVSVFAGIAHTAHGRIVFAVAQPRAAGRLRQARVKQERWLLDVLARHGGPGLRACIEPLTGPDHGAMVLDGRTSPVIKVHGPDPADPALLPPIEPEDGLGEAEDGSVLEGEPGIPEVPGLTLS